jgi:hypothetical protein
MSYKDYRGRKPVFMKRDDNNIRSNKTNQCLIGRKTKVHYESGSVLRALNILSYLILVTFLFE